MAFAGMVRVNGAEAPGARVFPAEVRATSSRGGASVELAQSDTAWRLVREFCPMRARATGAVIEAPLELRTLPVILTGDLGTATFGVMAARETVRVWVEATPGVVAGAGAPVDAAAAVVAVAASTGEIGSTEIVRRESATRPAERLRRHTRSRNVGSVTSRQPGDRRQRGRFAARWGRSGVSGRRRAGTRPHRWLRHRDRPRYSAHRRWPRAGSGGRSCAHACPRRRTSSR